MWVEESSRLGYGALEDRVNCEEMRNDEYRMGKPPVVKDVDRAEAEVDSMDLGQNVPDILERMLLVLRGPDWWDQGTRTQSPSHDGQ